MSDDTITQTLEELARRMRRGVGSTFYGNRADAVMREIVEPIIVSDEDVVGVDDVYEKYHVDALADVVVGWPHERWRCQFSDEDFWILVAAARRGDEE